VARPEPAGQTVSSVGSSGALELTATPSMSGTTAPPATDPAGAVPVGPAAGSSRPSDPTTAPAPSAEPATSAAPAPSAEPAPVGPVPGSPPNRISIPALSVDAPVSAVGVADDGEVQVPDDVATVGWYQFGPTPGEPGSSVLVGHVDDYRQGVGVLARIGDLNPGDTVEVTDGNGVVSAFTVVAREQWNKADTPLDRLFDRGGSARLVLLTCGGAFDDARLEYTDNIAVTAVPLVP
jgi:sortase (surface protein transpeptidase)